MESSLFSFVPESRIRDILDNLQAFTGLTIQLIDRCGNLLMTFGTATSYCTILTKKVFDSKVCLQLHASAGAKAQTIGDAYIFSCHADLNHIAFPLINQGELLASVIIGPFLVGIPDSTLVSELAKRQNLSPALALELYDELSTLTVLSPARVNQLKKLVTHLLSPLISGERALLLQSQQKMSQQARVNETIQHYKEQGSNQSSTYFHEKEKELLSKLRTGTIQEVKALLNELLGYILFSEGGQLESIRLRTIELTTLLSRVAIDGGAKTDSIYHLNHQFLTKLYQEKDLEDLCILMQEVVESFMNATFYEEDKGNPYIRKALRYIWDHYSQHLNVTEVADFVQLSPSYFSTLFTQVVGIPFREYLRKIRIEESKRLLLSKEYSLADIAISVGFPDQSYYCRVFKQLVGVSPRKFQG